MHGKELVFQKGNSFLTALLRSFRNAVTLGLRLDKQPMPMTEKTQSGATISGEIRASEVTQDEGLAATVSSYLDGELTGEDLAEFQDLLCNSEALSRQVADMRSIDRQLIEIGADILSEPIPEALLEALLRKPRR